MPTEQATLAAILDNVLAHIAEAEDDDHAQEVLAAYEAVLSDPERLAALTEELSRDEAEQLALDELLGVISEPSPLWELLGWSVDPKWKDPTGGKRKRWVSDTGERARVQISEPGSNSRAAKAKKPVAAAKTKPTAKPKAKAKPVSAEKPATTAATPPPTPSPARQPTDAERKQLQSIAAGAAKEMADPGHPMNARKAQLAEVQFGGGPKIKTIRSTKDAPLSEKEHDQMARSHARIGTILRINGRTAEAQAHYQAAQFHRNAAEAKKAAAHGVGKPISLDRMESPPHIQRAAAKVKESLLKKPPELQAVKDYTGAGYRMVNALMRKCPPDFQCVKGDTRRIMENVESAIASAPPLDEPTTIYRGVPLSPEAATAMVEAATRAQRSGGEFRMPSITSATTDPGVMETFSYEIGSERPVLFQIKARSGLAVQDVSNNPHEKEIIQSSQTRYRVVGVADVDVSRNGKNKGKRKVIYLEEL